jgi:predicted O-methyltransferase YrrM
MNWFQAISYIKYSVNKLSKSPKRNEEIVFMNEVVNNRASFYCFEEIENVRGSLLSNDKEIEVTDFGAGSKVFKSNRRKINAIAKYSLKEEKYGQLIFRLINFVGANTILELGTSLGVTTMYMAKANSKANVFTIEGCNKIASIAQNNFSKLSIHNIDVRTGNIDEELPKLLSEIDRVDVALVDGNHTEEATVRYFELLLTKSIKKSVLVFDDIYWSKEMNNAWQYIKQHERVTHSIDLFDLGIVFLK